MNRLFKGILNKTPFAQVRFCKFQVRFQTDEIPDEKRFISKEEKKVLEKLMKKVRDEERRSKEYERHELELLFEDQETILPDGLVADLLEWKLRRNN